MFASENHPETQHRRIEDTLTDVGIQGHVGHVDVQSEPFHWDCGFAEGFGGGF